MSTPLATDRPFVGREPEMAIIAASLAEAADHRGGVVLISGDAGIGKSRLVEAAAEGATRSGAMVLWGRAWESGGAPAFWPWTQILRAHVRHSPRELARAGALSDALALAQLLPEIREILPNLPPPPLDEEGTRQRVFSALGAVLRRASASAPLVLVLEDLHSADASSLLLLEYLAHELADARVLMLCTFRDEELRAGTRGRKAVTELARHPRTRQLVLPGLSVADIDTYLRAVTGESAAADVLGALAEETDGNALFLTELIRYLVVQGGLSAERIQGLQRIGVPQTVRDLIRRRLDRLSPQCVELLAVAAVLGREFDLLLLERMTQVPLSDALELLEDAVHARIVTETESRRTYAFTHLMVRDAIYDDLPRPRRQALHLRAGEALVEQSTGRTDEHVSELAHHFLLALPTGDRTRAVRYAAAAGGQAIERLAYEEAARLLGEALDAHGVDAEDESQVEILLALGDAHARAGEAATGKKRSLEAAAMAGRLDLGRHLARAALGYGGRFVWEASRGDPHLLRLLGGALDAIGPGDDPLRARLMARLAGGPLRDESDASQRDALSSEAVEIARRLDDPATLAYALDGRYAAIWTPERLAERQAVARELITVARRAADRERELQGHHYLCLALLETADLAGAEQEAAEQRRLARELQQPAQLFYVMTVDSMLATLQGRFEEAERLMPDALRMGQRAESAMAAIYGLFQRYDLARHRGGAAELLPELRELAAAYPTYVVAQSLIADALLRADRAADARAALRRLGADRFAVLPLNDEWLFAVTVLADVAVDLGEADLCRALHELLLPYSERVAVSAPDTCLGAVARTLGRLSATLGRSADARDHLERALTINQQLRSRPWVARTRHDLARLIAAAGDAQGAERLLEATITEATALGMEPLHADSVHLLGQIRSQPGAPQELAFLFTDIVGSTELMTAIGDAAWARLVAWHDDTLRALLAAYRGREVHHAGDGFFVVFDAADAAIACAKAIQRRLAEQRHDHGFAPDVRVGVHTATARVTRGDYQGRGVHQAARLAALASAGEILVSRSTLDRAGGGPTRDERVVELKGFREPVAVASIDWQTPDAVSAP